MSMAARAPMAVPQMPTRWIFMVFADNSQPFLASGLSPGAQVKHQPAARVKGKPRNRPFSSPFRFAFSGARQHNISMIKRPVLVTGATGYVGGRLVPKLLEAGYRVRAAGRSLEKLASRPWAGHPLLELVRVDLLDRTSLDEALAGCGPVFYLVHSMNPANMDFAEADRRSARNMVAAAEQAGSAG